jgi:hypothetical protein
MDEFETGHQGADRLQNADPSEQLMDAQAPAEKRASADALGERAAKAAIGETSGARADSVRPQEVPGPLGKPMTLESLPPPDTRRWVVRRKAEVIAAIRGGLLTAAEACARYRLSPEELELWQESIDRAGVPGLRVTRIQLYKDYVAPPPRPARPTEQDDSRVRDLSRSWGL